VSLRGPRADQVEVYLFGPGYGECVLVHLGNGEWMVVDSCTEPRSRRVPALDYLRSIDVDPASAVKLIVATHWHDDHIRGLARVLEACPAAEFVASQALRHDEFLVLVDAVEARPTQQKVTSGVREFGKILDVLDERAAAAGGRRQQKFAGADRRLMIGPTSGTAGPVTWEVHSLSPSDTAFYLALQSISKLIPTSGPKRRVAARRPNHTAVALLVRAGGVFVLLGADLEETGDPTDGWSAIVASTGRPTGRAGIFKVAHHGSSNGHHQSVWSDMLNVNPVAVLTPFVRGDVRLPGPDDVKRICSLTEHAYSTAMTTRKKPRLAAQMASKTRPGGVISVREVSGPSGQLRVRVSAVVPGANPEVQRIGSGTKLSELYPPPRRRRGTSKGA
jgi:beta-lactamase superfamily II metal-dependent hydrolase